MLSDRVQLNCPCSSVCKVYLSREWNVVGSNHTYGSYFFLEKQELSRFTLPFPCCFLTKKISLTANWRSSAVSPDWSLVLSLTSFLLKSAALISVSPHVTDSSTASWMKMYWSWEENNIKCGHLTFQSVVFALKAYSQLKIFGGHNIINL